MLFIAATSVTYAQRKIKIEYDAAGNVVQQYVYLKTENVYLDRQYGIKVYPNLTTGPVKIKVYDGSTGTPVSCKIHLYVQHIAGYAPVIDQTYTDGDIQIDLSSCPNGTYILYFIIFLNSQQPITNGQIKIIKQS